MYRRSEIAPIKFSDGRSYNIQGHYLRVGCHVRIVRDDGVTRAGRPQATTAGIETETEREWLDPGMLKSESEEDDGKADEQEQVRGQAATTDTVSGT